MRSPVLRAAALAAALLAAGTALAAPPAKLQASHPGFLAAKPFLDLAEPDDDVVEINVGPELLSSIMAGLDDPEVRKLVGELVAVHAVVIGLTGDGVAPRLERAKRLVQDTTKRLQDTGWEPLVRVKEKTSTVSVLTKAAGAEGKIHGLAVLVVETDEAEPQIVFANIAGTLDMALISRLSAKGLNLPGLDQIGRSGAD